MPGGGGGGGQPQNVTSTTTTQQELSPEQKQLIGLAMPAATQFAQSPPQYYPGNKIAPQSPLETQAQNMVTNAAFGPAQQYVNNALSGANFLSSGNALYAGSNPALGGYIDAATRPITQDFTNRVLPGIRSNAIGAGQKGGSREGIAQGLATQGYYNTLSDTTSKIANEAYAQGLGAMTKALGYAPATAQLPYSPAIALSNVGEQQRSFQQAQIDEAVRQYQYSQMAPYLAAQSVAQLAFGVPGGSATGSATGPSPYAQGTSPLQYGLAGVSGIAALAPYLAPLLGL